jgi:catechol 2,3-dioxygenase-like lactoylglutathione lyase family enzyme
MPAPFSILGLDHIVLRAADPAALEAFYLEVLGCNLELRQGRLTQLRAGRTLIDIVPAAAEGPAAGTSSSGGRQSRSPVPARRAVRRRHDPEAFRRPRHRVRRGEVALRRRGPRPLGLPARSGRQRRRTQGPGGRLKAASS